MSEKKKRKGHARPRGNGRWQLEVDVEKKLFGKGRKKRYRTVDAKNEEEANELLKDFIEEVTSADYVEVPNMWFVDFVRNIWVPKTKGKRLADTTFQTHVEYLELRILPAFQNFKLGEIEPLHIMDFLENLEEPGMRMDKYKDEKKQKENKLKTLASSTIFYHFRVLKNVFNFAVEIQALDKSPMDGVQSPSVEYEEVEPYTIDEAIGIYQALDDEDELLHWSLAIKLAIVTGMRRSELYGLDIIKHINLKGQVVHIRDALTYTKAGGYSLTKIKKGSKRSKIRDIALPDDLIHPLATLIERRLREREQFTKEEQWRGGKHFLLLSHENGEPYNPSSIKNWWIRFLKRHGFRYLNIHGLRHTMVTLLIELGIPLAQISKRAGHSGVGITNDTYGHRVQTIDELATARLSEVLNSKKGSENESDENIENQHYVGGMSADPNKKEKSAIL